MKSRKTTWEVVVAGCIFMALGVYLIHPPDLSTSSPEHTQHTDAAVPHLSEPEQPSASKTIIIDLKKLENLEKLKKLEQLKELKQLKEFEQIEKELRNLEKELNTSIPQPHTLSIPALKSLPQILVY